MMTVRRRSQLTLLLAITAVAFLLRLIVCIQLADTPAVASPGMQTDMATYVRLAHDVRNGIFPDHFDYQPFYYTVILPWLLPPAAQTGPLLLAFNMLIGSAAVLLTGLAASLVIGRRGAWFAALLLALSQFHIFYTPFALYEVLLSCLVALTLYLTLLAWRTDRLGHWLLAAAALSAAALTRGNAILLTPVLLGALCLRRPRTRHLRSLALSLAVVAIIVLPQLPYAIHNSRYLGRPTGASTAGPKVLALGNTPEAPAAGLAYPLTYTKWVALSDAGQRSMFASVLSWAASHPAQFLELNIRKLMHFWDAAEIPNNVSFEHDGKTHSSLLRLPCLIPFGIIATLALAGIFLSVRRRRGTLRLVLLFMLVLCAGTVVFYILARFRLASLPVLCLLASCTFRRVQLAWQQRIRLAPCLVAIIASAALVYGALPLYQFAYEADIHNLLTPDGICAHFPQDTTLIHDHGPLPMGAGQQQPFAIPDGGLTLTKRFRLPQDAETRQLLVQRPFTARLMTAGHPATISISHAGTTLEAKRVTRYAFATFYEAEFPHCQPDADGSVTLTFSCAPTLPERPAAIVVDLLRDYGRSEYVDPTTRQPQPLHAEPFAEIQFQHQP